jgi:quinol monooxygenase YgiN
MHNSFFAPSRLALAAISTVLAIPALSAGAAVASQNEPAASSGRISIISRLSAKPGHERELASRLAATVAASKHEPGNIASGAYRSREQNGVFYLREVYRDTSALNYHLAQSYSGALIREINRCVRPGGAKIDVLDSVKPS